MFFFIQDLTFIRIQNYEINMLFFITTTHILLLYQFHYIMDKPDCAYIDQYNLHGLLGDGGQASVYLCSKNKQFFAAKVYLPGASKVESFKREVQFLKKLNFKHLINVVDDKLEAKVKLQGKEQITRPVLFLEFAEGGELFDYIAKQGRFPAQICRSLTKMLIAAVQYLNSVGVAHRDLKPENVLFDKQFSLKVSDFGLSTLSEGHQKDYILYSKLGTEGYKPPQMQQGKYTGLQADLFAIGVILFVMYAGTPPFLSTKKTDKIYRLIKQKNFAKFWALHQKKKPDFFPDSLKRLFNAFFSSQIHNRPTFQTLKQDQWLNGDQAMQQEIQKQMNARYQRILANDENKQKIEKAKLDVYKTEMEEQMKMCEKQGSSSSSQQMQDEGEMKQGEQKKKKKRGQTTNIHFYNIKTEDLPVSDKHQLVPTQVAPAVAVAWLENHFSEAYQKKNVFLKGSCLQIEPSVYNFKFNQKDNKIEINLTFMVKDGIEQNQKAQQQELSIQGKLVKTSDGKFSIDWQNGKGNAFWLSSLINDLNSELKILV